MGKKTIGLVAAAIILGAGVVSAQAADPAPTTPGFAIHGQIMTEAWVGPTNKTPKNNGATLHDDGSFINFQYNFDQFSGAFIQVDLGELPGIENHFNNNVGGFNMDYLGDVKVWTDILGELGVKPVSLKLTLGKTDASSKWNAPGALGIGDALQGDGENDSLNWILDIGISKDIYPLVLTLSSDLDFGVGGKKDAVYGGQSAWNNQGLSGFAQLASNGYANDSISLDWNVYYGGYITKGASANVYKDGSYAHHIGGTIGVGILGLPINLKVGGAVEYFKYTAYAKNGKTGNKGLDWSVGVNTGMDKAFTLNVAFAGVKEFEDPVGSYYATVGSGGARKNGYSLDDAGHAYGYILGVDGSLDMIEKSSIYAGLSLRFGDGFKGNLNHRISYEVGYQFKPIDNVSLFTGWQHGRDSLHARGYKELTGVAGTDNHNEFTTDNVGRWFVAGSYTW